MIERLVSEAHEKGGFAGTWLYNEFGIKRYSLVLQFGDGSLTFYNNTCKKL